MSILSALSLFTHPLLLASLSSNALFWLAIFVVTLMALVKASDWFIDSAEEVGLRMGISPFLIGITIIGLGTSLPELVSSIFAVLSNATEIPVSNVIGSNIANVFLVMGAVAVAARVKQLKLDFSFVDQLTFIASALFLGVTIYDGIFQWYEGLCCILALVAYLWVTVKQDAAKPNSEEDNEKIPEGAIKPLTIATLVASLILIPLSARYNITSIIALSELLNIGKEVIALSAVALGTSLPELFVSITALRKGNAEMALGNILGSNIFNILAVMGIPVFFSETLSLDTSDSSIISSWLLMLVATAAYYFIVRSQKMTRVQGILLLAIYITFVVSLYVL